MEVDCEDPRFETLLNNERALRKAHGAEVVKKLAIRFTTIRESNNLAELHALPGRTHPLTGSRAGRFAMDLPNGRRLEFRPTPPVPTKPDGGIDLTKVTSITLIEISNHYT
jgi:proteic killer suppression protein